MVRHIVMYWLKDKEKIGETVAILNSMRGKIPGLLKVEAAKDETNSPRSCDLCLHTVLESREALEAYIAHPVHVPVKEHMHSVMERSASADFEVDAI
ncbi:MAG TPA: Dabb family protein [Candidatus Limiplasma sp.]|nr:Dabb family protein [Candidatus Limiplasma sp.]HRX08842.1 Dabb family protein [Candidatus Limiplasma sp.]